MKKVLVYSLSLFMALFLSGCGSQEEATTVVQNSKSFEELKIKSNKTYTLKTVENKTITFTLQNDKLISKDLNGKYVLLNFWATWCPPCIKEMPILTQLVSQNSDNFTLVGLLYEKNKDPKELKQFIDKHKINFPITIGSENFRLAQYYNVKKIPESFLFDKNGNFVKKIIGEISKEELESILKK